MTHMTCSMQQLCLLTKSENVGSPPRQGVSRQLPTKDRILTRPKRHEESTVIPAPARGNDAITSGGADELVSALLTASRALVGVSARSLARVEDAVTITQFRTLVV